MPEERLNNEPFLSRLSYFNFKLLHSLFPLLLRRIAVSLLTHFLCQIPNDLSSLTSALLKEYAPQLYATVD